MTAEKFAACLKKAIDDLNEDDINRIRRNIRLDEDYVIDDAGMTHIVKKILTPVGHTADILRGKPL